MTQLFAQPAANYRPDRCESIRHGDRYLPHAQRMELRRAAQLARIPGFTSVRNRRVEAMALKALQDTRALGYAGARLEAEAFAMLARKLPPLGFAKRHRAPRPSKNDSADYRRGGGVREGAVREGVGD